jgi:hypothetical protein
MIQESRGIRDVPIQRMLIFRSGALAGRKRIEAVGPGDEARPGRGALEAVVNGNEGPLPVP